MKRFYKNAHYEFKEGRYYFYLDNKPIKTPLGHLLSTISENRAEKTVLEWQNQSEVISPKSMPVTKFLNSTLDRIQAQKSVIMQQFLEYAQNDCIFYFSEHLQVEQNKNWLPIIQCYENKLDTKLFYGSVLSLDKQSQKYLDYIQQELSGITDEELAGLHVIITALGSILLALHAFHGHISYETALLYSRLEEDYNIQEWGLDMEAEKQRLALEKDYNEAVYFLGL